MRKYAAYALGELGAEARSALPNLRKALDDPEKPVRDAAAAALKKIEAP